MAHDIFTGGPSASPIQWSTSGAWSAGLPGTSAVVEQTGAGINSGVGTIGGLILDSGASLTVDYIDFVVTGTGDATFGGATSILTIESDGYLGVNSPVTLAIGTVVVESNGEYEYSGSGGAQTINVTGEFLLEGSNNDDTITVNAPGSSGAPSIDTGSNNGGIVHLNGGIWIEAGTDNTTTVDMSGGGMFDVQTAFGGTINDLNTSGHVYVTESGGTPSSYTINANDTVTLSFTGASAYTLTFDSTSNLSITESGSQFIIGSSTPVCFCSGTRIRTERGEVTVEDLAVGDLAITTSGEARPIVWIGHRRLQRPGESQQPVRVMAGAFGENRPERDLFLSPGHAVCVDVMDQVFVPIEHLINGATIARVEVPEVTYWHVELKSHDVLLAEGLPCESYMDAGNRAFFGREYGRLAAVDAERVAESLSRYARPFVDHGPIVEAIRERLRARAETFGNAAEHRRIA